jgi:hypothetical protein
LGGSPGGAPSIRARAIMYVGHMTHLAPNSILLNH